MYIITKNIFTGLLGAALAVSSAHAEARGDAMGYVTDSSGNIVRSGSGECWHSGSWTPADASVVGCDGVVLDTSIAVLKGKGTGDVAGIVIPAASLFATDKAELNKDGQDVIEEYRKTIKPELSQAYAVIVVGHADSTGSARHNLDLSFDRAVSVAEYLISTGLKADSLRIIGRGDNHPLASNDSAEGRALNRRVEIFVIGEVRALDAIIFPAAALFKPKSGELSGQGVSVLETNRQGALEQFSRANYIEIVGHTDDVGDEDYNMDLSMQRAKSVRNYLVSKGLDPSKVLTRAMGESLPVASNATPEGRAENRRVEILVLGRMK